MRKTISYINRKLLYKIENINFFYKISACHEEERHLIFLLGFSLFQFIGILLYNRFVIVFLLNILIFFIILQDFILCNLPSRSPCFSSYLSKLLFL